MGFVVYLILLSLSWCFLRLFNIGKREKYLPPGPPALPLLGNMHMIPTEYIHFKFTEWARTYGSIYSLKIGSGTFIVISGVGAARELLDKRSGSTADRPPNHIADTITQGMNMVLARYKTWRTLRRTAHAILTPQGVNEHLPIQKAEAIQLLHDFLTNPKDFYTHTRRYANSVIMSIVYGKRSPKYETKHSTDFFEAQHLWEYALEPGAHPPMDIIPILKYVPERWAPWKTLCKLTRTKQRELYFGLLNECRARSQSGLQNHCFMEQVLQRQEEFGLTNEVAGYLGGVLIEGGSDTTSALLQSIVLGLVAFPDAQRKAHEEMDRVVGEGRIPTLEDFPNLPYVDAIIKEAHRFRPLAPVGIPHGALKDEEYLGYVIPKGSTIFMNYWGMFHDPGQSVVPFMYVSTRNDHPPEVFDDPEVFNPDRYIANEYGVKPNVDTQDFRDSLPFGFGRRICPGRHLAQNSLTINAMNMIWAFDFSPAVDPDTGLEIPIDIWNYEKGILTAPRPFQCKITPRSQARADIIEREFAEAADAFALFENS